MGETCSMEIRQIFIFFGNLKGCGHLRDLDVDGDDSVKLLKKIWLRVANIHSGYPSSVI